MGYEYLDHEADMGILAWGIGLEKAFEDGAKALFDAMVDTKQVDPIDEVVIECDALDIAALFVEWLNELLTQKDIRDMFFSNFEIDQIQKEANGFSLRATVSGEIMNPEKHLVKTEIKGATYSGLEYNKEGNKHILQCVVDL